MPILRRLRNIMRNAVSENSAAPEAILDPPPNQRPASAHTDEPAAREIERMAAAFETYTRDNETAYAKTTKHNRKVRWWTRFATIAGLAYTIITALILIASIRGIQE